MRIDVAATLTIWSPAPATALLQVAVADPVAEQLTVLSGGRPVEAEEFDAEGARVHRLQLGEGDTTFIRVGSTAALQPGIEVGDLIVSEGSLRNDGTTAAYVPAGYPAVPDLELTLGLTKVARRMGAAEGFAVHTGINATDDAFYAETPEWIAQLSALGITNVEMESSALYVVARQRGLRAGMVCAVSGNLVTGDVVYGRPNERLAVGWDHSIRVALETVIELGL
jgi:uridine phosphorylase